MNCCEKCFEDKVLVKHIRAKGKKGHCDFCKARSVRVIPAASLRQMFEPLSVDLPEEKITEDTEEIRPRLLLFLLDVVFVA